MVDVCDISDDGKGGPFIIVDLAGNALQPDGRTFGAIAKTYHLLEAARVDQPETPFTRIIFNSQRRKFVLCGCLK